MYLAGIHGLAGTLEVLIGNSESMSAAQAASQCAASGGMLAVRPANYSPGTPQIERRIDNFYCVRDAGAIGNGAGSAAPTINTNISVPTSTQVNPQLTPQFVQQSNPSGSPVTGTPTQSQNNPAVSDNTTQSLVDLLRSQIQAPPAMAVPSTTSYTDAGQSLTVPTPLGPTSIPVATLSHYAPWIALALIGGAIMYSKRKAR